ncbi:hypothetical protein ACFYO1_41315 [Nocardia sp. NPDC006044]|uniref:hypothetical protein n=1 Tax=Nocardia sp. NPDC006044 TaxID=3364306 RepID=UPI00367FDC36
MNYPQYPGGYNPYPGYSTGMPAPSGATAITAGVLASVGAVGQLLGGGISLAFGLLGRQLDEYDTTGLFSDDWFQTWAIASGAVSLVVAIVLGVGAIGMFSRKSFGRLLVVVGCVAVIVSEIVGFAIARSFVGSSDSLSGTLSGGTSGLFGLVFPLATAVLALLPMTSRWLAHTPVATVPQQYGFSYPGPQGQAWPQPPVDQPQGAWAQPGQGVPQSAAPSGSPWQQSPPQAVWGAPAQPGASGGESPAAQGAWGQPAPGQQAAWDQPAVPQAAWGAPAQPNSSAPVDGQSAPDAARGASAEPGSSVPSAGQPASPAAWGAPAQVDDVAPKVRSAEPAAGGDAPASIGRNDETVLRPPNPGPPRPADDSVWRPPSA